MEDLKEGEKEQERIQAKKNRNKEIFSWLKVYIFAIITAFCFNHYVVVNASIPTGSMENTIMTGDRIFANRLAYLFDKPHRGDIVVFPFPDDETEDYVKRIIGMPGEKIEGIDGLVYINGEPLRETYVTAPLDSDFGPYFVPENSYFMMGDNRGISADSRYWEHPFVEENKIVGKAVLRYYPKLTWIK